MAEEIETAIASMVARAKTELPDNDHVMIDMIAALARRHFADQGRIAAALEQLANAASRAAGR